VIPALTGPAVFSGIFFHLIHNFELRLQYAVVGPDIKEVFDNVIHSQLHLPIDHCSLIVYHMSLFAQS